MGKWVWRFTVVFAFVGLAITGFLVRALPAATVFSVFAAMAVAWVAASPKADRKRASEERAEKDSLACCEETIKAWTREAVLYGGNLLNGWKTPKKVWMSIFERRQNLPEWVQAEHLQNPKAIHWIVQQELWECGLEARVCTERGSTGLISVVEFRNPMLVVEKALLQDSCGCGNDYLLGKGCYWSWAEKEMRGERVKFCHELPLGASQKTADRIMRYHMMAADNAQPEPTGLSGVAARHGLPVEDWDAAAGEDSDDGADRPSPDGEQGRVPQFQSA